MVPTSAAPTPPEQPTGPPAIGARTRARVTTAPGPRSPGQPGPGFALPEAPHTQRSITVGSPARARHALDQAMAELLDGRERLWVLEAGAGERPLFGLPEDAYIVGVAPDRKALHRNQRLDERVVSELAEYRPWATGFDLITCWNTLDALDDPAPVLGRFATWTAPDGLVVLAVPNLLSPHGLVTRLTRRRRLRRSLIPSRLRRRFAAHGFTAVFEAFFEDGDQAALRRRLHVTHGWWKTLQAVVRVLSCGLLDAARTDYIVVFRRGV